MLSSVNSSQRGCGYRIKGGIYLETPLSPFGQPIESFLCCQPQKLTFDVPCQGQMAIEVNGVTHLLDWIGQEHYPNVADFIEEVRRLGLSRRTNLTVPLEKLTSQSRLMCVHAKAFIHNYMEYGAPTWGCPRDRIGHPIATEMCSGVWWHDIVGGEIQAVDPEALARDEQIVVRTMPSFKYFGAQRPAVEELYSPAIFAMFPIAQLAVVRGEAGEHDAAAEALAQRRLNLDWGVTDS